MGSGVAKGWESKQGMQCGNRTRALLGILGGFAEGLFG